VLRRIAPPLAIAAALIALAVPAAAPAASARGGDRDAIVVIVGDVAVARGEVVDGVYIASGDARIAGRVDGDVVVFSGDVTVSGTIDGSLVVTDGVTRLLPGAEVADDVVYGDERPAIAPGARVRGDLENESWPDLGSLGVFIGFFAFWLAIGVSAALLGALLLLISPRAADAIYTQMRERIGPTIAIGIAIGIVLPVAAVLAAITLLGIPLAVGIVLALLPLAAIAYVASAWALGRLIVKPPRKRIFAFLAGLAILRALALVPVLGFLVGLVTIVFGFGLIGAAIGAAREPRTPAVARTPGS
jgi:hypothetical protein